MLYLVITFIISFLGCFLIIRLKMFHDTYRGPQKFHVAPTSRIGGLAIYVSLLCVSFAFLKANKPFAKEFLFFVLSSSLIFLSGLAEDVTKKVSPKWRLLGGFFSGVIFYFLFKVSVVKVNFAVLDVLLSFPVVSVAFTAFAIAGVSHAFNIIDGFNGLASGITILVLGAYAYVSFLHHDFFLLYLSLVSLFATLGFFLWNYPFGYIFLGDGGAYLLGYICAALGVLLVNRHPDVSPWFPFLLVLYPVWETLFSIYRRRLLKNYPPHMPDAIHFHQLLYRRITHKLLGKDLNNLERNYFTTPFLWIMGLLCFVPAIIFWKNTHALMLFSLLFVVFYTWLYSRIVKFRTPKILKIKEAQVLNAATRGRNRGEG